ncbi:hypothetical protein Csa_023885, partial [Cucumis sativus]
PLPSHSPNRRSSPTFVVDGGLLEFSNREKK